MAPTPYAQVPDHVRKALVECGFYVPVTMLAKVSAGTGACLSIISITAARLGAVKCVSYVLHLTQMHLKSVPGPAFWNRLHERFQRHRATWVVALHTGA